MLRSLASIIVCLLASQLIPTLAAIAPRLPARAPSPPRPVFLLLWLSQANYINFIQNGQMNRAGMSFDAVHSALEIGGYNENGASEGNLRLEVAITRRQNAAYMTVNVNDYGPTATITYPQDEYNLNLPGRGGTVQPAVKLVYAVGSVELRNTDFADPQTGRGLAWNVWAPDTSYRSLDNGCNAFTQNMIKALFGNFVSPLSVPGKIYESNDWYKRLFPEDFHGQAENTPIRYRSWSNRALNVDQEFAVTAGASDSGSSIIGDNMQSDEESSTAPPSEDVGTMYRAWADEGYVTDDEVFSGDPMGYEPEGAMQICGEGIAKRGVACSPQGFQDLTLQSKGQSQVLWRTAGVLSSAITFSEEALQSLRGVTILAQPVILLVEFVEGQYLAAALSAAAIAVGILASLLIAGPIGELVGTALAVLLPFLPALFDVKEPGHSSNVTEILQFAFFGDRSITGNEGCNKNLVAAGQPPNCTIMYGPATIAKVLNMNIYDAAMLMIQANLGYSMSIPDIAAAFHVIDHSKQNDGASSYATIDCGATRSCLPPGGPVEGPGAAASEVMCAPADAYACRTPKFNIKRNLVTLPTINQTADVVFNSVNAGTCKLIADPSEGLFLYPPFTSSNGAPYTNASIPKNGTYAEAYGSPVNVTGRPVAVACNLSTSYVPGAIDPNTTFAPSAIYNDTTDNSTTRAFCDPDPPAPFSGFVTENSTCLWSSTTPDNKLCLPAGTFSTCQGDAFGISTAGMDTLSLWAPSSQFTINFDPSAQVPDHLTAEVILSDRTSDNNFKGDITLATSMQLNFTILSPPIGAAIGMCIYSLPNFQGDVSCMGPGGANFTDNLQNKAQSVTLTPGLEAWLYPVFYGNQLGVQITQNVHDLASIPFDTSDTFSQKAAAAWIYNATTTTCNH